ncbi:MGH1-like glycoside hydrolase domain-containing protein [Rhodoblastus sp.]|uniref:MGH1-like glycoside hydrolase domain-containing protein n=1 Tax=Rhodoblastus sp. TaxID=1962975 RepID=UPI003F9DD16B
MKTETANAECVAFSDTAEGRRLARIAEGEDWRAWGPYLAERQWGVVREDYSADGDAWAYFPHDHARSRAYRWGEDGLGGFADCRQGTCMALALWNGRDAILKERMFGLTNAQGNHGEDVKELYYYLDGVPSHAYMRMLYKYPQAAFPYDELIEKNAERGLDQPEYELIDTGLFDDSRYFDVAIEYAKAEVDDILLRVTVTNRGPEAAELHVLPHIWFRNSWSWSENAKRPVLRAGAQGRIALTTAKGEEFEYACAGVEAALFCDNETNVQRLYGAVPQGHPKDAINDCVVNGRREAVNPELTGTKAAFHATFELAPGGSAVLRARLRRPAPRNASSDPFADFDRIFAARIAETDEFYAALQRGVADPDQRLVQRQAFAGMLWCKQFYGYDVRRWLAGDPTQPPPPPARRDGRNANWLHLAMGDVDPDQPGDILSMPDSWEYPWFAAWDLAFHAVTFALIDPAFAKSQLTLLTQSRCQHPNGRLAAYEWDFNDINPPVQAWAALQIYEIDRKATGIGDVVFLERIFHKLLLNFTWWVNSVDAGGRNIFQGGFLGLDNIGLFDMRQKLPDDAQLDQSDGTAWAAAFSLSMMRIALEIALVNPVYEDLATKFFEHFLDIAGAIHGAPDQGDNGLWDDEEEFYFDMLRLPGQKPLPLRIFSVVGLIPIFATEVLHEDFLDRLPQFKRRMDWYVEHRPDLARLVSDWRAPNGKGYRLLSLLRWRRLTATLKRALSEEEFLSPFGLRSVSKIHAAHPFSIQLDGQSFTLDYEPGEGRTRIYGGNSNWRGPVWMPINALLIQALRKLHLYYGDAFRVEAPTGSGIVTDLCGAADELTRRVQSLFLRGADGKRPYQRACPRFDADPAFRDLNLFHEYFHGDDGRGLGASHQTGWTGFIAVLFAPLAQGSGAQAEPASTTNAPAHPPPDETP